VSTQLEARSRGGVVGLLCGWRVAAGLPDWTLPEAGIFTEEPTFLANALPVTSEHSKKLNPYII